MNIIKKIGKVFDTLWVWAVYSSANPGKISGTVKWGMVTLGTMFTMAFGFGHVQFPTDQWTAIGDSVISLIQGLAVSVAAIGAIVSGVRKVWATVFGEHASMTDASPTQIPAV